MNIMTIFKIIIAFPNKKIVENVRKLEEKFEEGE